MRVIGTAGHVDHGKSTLIAALTGTHPDRLKEEQAREMTIELGFGWMTMPNGEEVGIVDVPGHRDFIENMLSGIGGIDAALLVIAADEGVMPQTREHLAILDLLRIPGGVIVLTKTDLAPDPVWLDLLETDIRAVLADTVLRDAPLVRVSAKNKSGLDTLVATLGAILEERPARPDLNRPRLPIDRAFSMSGFGTVVTGTLSDGHLAVGDEVEILPGGQKGRIRGLQTHKRKAELALPGSRTAVNISGVDTERIRRGDVLAHAGHYQTTRRIDVQFRLLGDVSAPIKHGDQVKFFVGASETMARIRLLGTEGLNPGEDAWIQLELNDPIVTVRGDRYILRRPSPGETLGGGVVVDHQPRGRHRRFDEGVMKSLASLAQGSPSDILLEAALALNVARLDQVVAKSRLEAAAAEHALNESIQNGQLILLEQGEIKTTSDLLVMPVHPWQDLRARLEGLLDSHHKQFPLRRGLPREELKSRLKLAPRAFNAVLKKLAAEKVLTDTAGVVARTGFEINLEAGDQARVRELMRKFDLNPTTSPSPKECRAEVGEEVFNALTELGDLVIVSPEVVFRKKDYDELIEKTRSLISEKGQASLAEVRDALKTTRKYAQALLEHMDSLGLTTRAGDFRRLSN